MKNLKSVIYLILFIFGWGSTMAKAPLPNKLFVALPICMETQGGVISQALFETTSDTKNSFSNKTCVLDIYQNGVLIGSSTDATWYWDPIEQIHMLSYDISALNLQYNSKCYDWTITALPSYGVVISSNATGGYPFCDIECPIPCNINLTVTSQEMMANHHQIIPTSSMPAGATYTIYNEQGNVIHQSNTIGFVTVPDGCYTVEVKLNGCVETVCLCTACNKGLTNPDKDGDLIWQASPNPVTTHVTIEPVKATGNEWITDVRIFDQMNNVVYQKSGIKEADLTLGTSQWARGSYFIIVNQTESITIIK